MFPPKRTSDPQEMLTNLWASIERGGPTFLPDGRLIPREKNFECVFYLAPGKMSPDTRDTLSRYIRGYAQASGWTVKWLRFRRTHAAFEIAASKAASRRSRKV